MHRETFIAKLTDVQQTVEQLLAQLQASEHDKFAAYLYRSRREYDQLANAPENRASKSSDASSQRSTSRRAWASRAASAVGAPEGTAPSDGSSRRKTLNRIR
jgi:hypothetical protein